MCTNCEHLRTNLVLFAVIEHFRTVPLILRSSSGTAGGPVLRKRRIRYVSIVAYDTRGQKQNRSGSALAHLRRSRIHLKETYGTSSLSVRMRSR